MVRMLSFLVLAGLMCLNYTTAQCPPAHMIRPCTCEGSLIHVVECAEITEMEILVDVFERSGDRSFRSFALTNSSLMYLPANAISTKRFILLLIRNVSMTALFDAVPPEDNEIIYIVIQNATFQLGLGWELFRTLKKLEAFDAEFTEIKSLDESFTDNINRNITNIILTNTRTKKIQYNAFAQLEKLFQLKITGGGVKSLQRSMFASPSALKELDFSGNQIESLPDDLFTNMPVLSEISFKDNKLHTVSQAVFESVSGHRYFILHLEGNPLACDCSMLWFVKQGKQIVFGVCVAPEDKQGKFVQDLKMEDLDYC